ncbi:hypothetical protein FH972_023083 [Carpinus fangiana]|uniref:Uncharacterized protein n=1 Tax=Carpinus fangiana TaxID=176857 RepID=A0A5N6KUI3_9ROSI|nr:hypothetical protein FH972_023083 [Carpinus fangiana]
MVRHSSGTNASPNVKRCASGVNLTPAPDHQVPDQIGDCYEKSADINERRRGLKVLWDPGHSDFLGFSVDNTMPNGDGTLHKTVGMLFRAGCAVMVRKSGKTTIRKQVATCYQLVGCIHYFGSLQLGSVAALGRDLESLIFMMHGSEKHNFALLSCTEVQRKLTMGERTKTRWWGDANMHARPKAARRVWRFATRATITLLRRRPFPSRSLRYCLPIDHTCAEHVYRASVVAFESVYQTLNMATTQASTRRKSARSGDGEEDARPQKKPRVEESVQPNARKAPQKKAQAGTHTRPPAACRTALCGMEKGYRRAGSVGLTCATAYDEDADGFTFRKRPKAAPKAKQVVEEQVAHNAPKSASRGRAKRTSADAIDEAPTKRRSARLSGESAQDEQQQGNDAAAKSIKKQPRLSQDPPRLTPAPHDGPLHVEKKRETKIALPFADTPIINRNRELRDISNSSRRRSSSGMRGRRASSLMDSGTSSAMPHGEVKTEEFYKHINQDLPEPTRMRQLLTWCGTRALSELPKSRASGHFNAIRAGM